MVQDAGFQQSHQQSMEELLKNYRESVSGVSVDEEMVQLVQFQHAYEAAAKLVVTVDEMLDTIIGLVR